MLWVVPDRERTGRGEGGGGMEGGREGGMERGRDGERERDRHLDYTIHGNIHLHVHVSVHVLLCLVCLFDLACFFLPSFSHLSLKHVHMYVYYTQQHKCIHCVCCTYD